MPGVTKYNLVDDAHDLRLPMHNDEVFKHGVCFEAKVRTFCNRYFLGGRNESMWSSSLYVSNNEMRAIDVTATVTTSIHFHPWVYVMLMVSIGNITF